MTFVEEMLTDEERQRQGFAVKMNDVTGVDMRRGMKFASSWVVDRERNAYIVMYFKGSEVWRGEMGWNNETILINTLQFSGYEIPTELRNSEEKKTKKHLENFFKIREIVIPEKLKNNLPEIEQLIKEGLTIYTRGTSGAGKTNYVEIPPEAVIRFQKTTKSALKLKDFSIVH